MLVTTMTLKNLQNNSCDSTRTLSRKKNLTKEFCLVCNSIQEV